MIPALQSIEDVVRRESSYALTLGAALLGAVAGSTLQAPGLSAFPSLVILGLTGWLSSDPLTPPARLAGFSMLGCALALGPGRGVGPAEIALTVPFVAPAALVVVLFALTLFAQLRPLTRTESHEDGALARLTAARWLFVIAAMGALLAWRRGDLSLATACGLVLCFAAARWTLGHRERRRLRGWLSRVRAGDLERWRIADADTLHGLDSLALKPLIRAEPHDGVLVQAGGAGPYRDGARGRPIALVPRGRPLRSRVGWALDWPEVGFVVARLAAMAAPTPALGLGLYLCVWGILDAPFTQQLPGALFIGAVVTGVAVWLASRLAWRRRRHIWATGACAYALIGVGLTLLATA